MHHSHCLKLLINNDTHPCHADHPPKSNQSPKVDRPCQAPTDYDKDVIWCVALCRSTTRTLSPVVKQDTVVWHWTELLGQCKGNPTIIIFHTVSFKCVSSVHVLDMTWTRSLISHWSPSYSHLSLHDHYLVCSNHTERKSSHALPQYQMPFLLRPFQFTRLGSLQHVSK